jgi:ADP-ribose pyrophosphatase YjhB (NUDIX family)
MTREPAANENLFRITDKMQKIVVACFILKEGRLLLARKPKSKKLGPDKCHLPGCRVEHGQDSESALNREFREKFGVEVRLTSPACYSSLSALSSKIVA